MEKKEIPLEFDTFYHVFNRGNNSENLFNTDSNYQHFLNLFQKYICPVAETYAWVFNEQSLPFSDKNKRREGDRVL